LWQLCRRNDRREATEKPLNRHKLQTGSPADAAEMTQKPRLAPVIPPPMPVRRMGGRKPPKMQFVFNTKTLRLKDTEDVSI